jgi:TRAP-type C4-dicarboxylate transport system permease small subunit
VEKAYAAWRAFQDKFLAHAAALVLLGCTLLALLEVVRRYVFGFSYEWQQDAVTFFIVSGVFLYFGISQRHNEHLNVIVLLELLQSKGPVARQAAELIKLVALVLSFVFMLAVIWWGIPEVEDAHKYGSRTESLAFPLAPFLWALLVGFAMMAVTMAFQIWFEIQKLRGRSVPEEGPVLDRMPD